MSVSIIQITVTRVLFKHIERQYVAQRYVTHVMLQEFRCQTALVASRARRLITDLTPASVHSVTEVVNCITLRYIGLAAMLDI